MKTIPFTPFLFFCALNFVVTPVYCQEIIQLKNPSFEQNPNKGTYASEGIVDWTDCSKKLFPAESPPDIHPGPKPFWGVVMEAKDGMTYLGLVTRYSNTFETISQKLKQPLRKGKCYTISVFLALSKKYDSPTPRSVDHQENFANPVELMIWAGEESCGTDQLLAKSGAIANNEWIKYSFKLSPDKTYPFLTLEAFYVSGSLEPYNGHILIDGFSPIVEIECD